MKMSLLVLRPSLQTFLVSVTVVHPDGTGCPYKHILVNLN